MGAPVSRSGTYENHRLRFTDAWQWLAVVAGAAIALAPAEVAAALPIDAEWTRSLGLVSITAVGGLLVCRLIGDGVFSVGTASIACAGSGTASIAAADRYTRARRLRRAVLECVASRVSACIRAVREIRRRDIGRDDRSRARRCRRVRIGHAPCSAPGIPTHQLAGALIAYRIV